MRPPIHEQPDSAILARVAVQLVAHNYEYLAPIFSSPSDTVYAVSRNLPLDGFGQLRFALHSLAAHVALGIQMSRWRSEVCYRAMSGGVFRWHFFALYKQNRNPYPRVTNRGVQTSLGAQQGLVFWSPDDA